MARSDPAVFTLVEAAQILGIGRSTAYELVARDEFPVPVLKIGRSLRVSRVRLLEFINGATSGGVDE